MNTVTVKIESWDESSKTLVCRFASDTTSSSNPDDYNAVAFQPHLMWPQATTSSDVMTNIARAGASICQEIANEEALNNDAAQLSVYSGLSGQTQTFNVADIQEPPVPEGVAGS